MRIYVLGAGGMLGDCLYKYFNEKGHEVVATDINRTSSWVEFCDVRDYHAMHFDASEFRPDVIMNLAAKTDMEECESFVKDALDTNVGGSANCAMLASKLGVPYVYISTAGIFDGAQEYYVDTDRPNPLSVYGKSKYWGELVARTVPQHIVLRCGWQMCSIAQGKDKKFIGKIMKQLKAGATELNVVADKLGTPTYGPDFTRQIERLLDVGSYGVWNAVCKGSASRYDVAVELVSLLGLQDRIKINVVPSSFWAKEYFAPRPPSEKLITVKLDACGLNVMRSWKICLKEYVTENPEYFKCAS